MSHRNNHLTGGGGAHGFKRIGWSFALVSTAALFASVWNLVIVLLEWGPRRLLVSPMILLDAVLLALWAVALTQSLALVRAEEQARLRLFWITIALAAATAVGSVGWAPSSAVEVIVTVLLVVYFLLTAILLRSGSN